ncbi:S8 family serine peptidase [Paenibacillus oenotherae]|uniref:S8 family serine peptidase n=1 Tax=Paenibacillus oenotherae TaxID=1435645 RepID=A0ABS7D656_9BACL|nr:carbohydrate binding domain-containing protein [Paenibacillus oenotherae]MBW7475413.1 S8 family serine peptidase [Paenibacillus oenotherae]
MMIRKGLLSLLMFTVVFTSVVAFGNAPATASEDKEAKVDKYFNLSNVEEIVVKFKDGVNLSYEDGVERELASKKDRELSGTFSEFPDLKVNRLFTIFDKQSKAKQDKAKAVFQNYFTIPVPKGADAQKLLESLNRSELVDEAYPKLEAVEPTLASNTTPVQPSNDPNYSFQGYANAAAQGINAPYAWQYEGGDGKGISYYDIERGWALNHEDLVAHSVPFLAGGTNQSTSANHGTAVLGVISSVDNTIGNIGLASKAQPHAASYVRGGFTNIAETIILAADDLDPGDVILLEVQVSGNAAGWLPVETWEAEYDAIRYAVSQGITVVEAAGNGTVNLDTYQSYSGKYVLNRTSPDYQDSGAIMVGAGSDTVPHTRMYFSNYGNRIDAFGWGTGVHTLAAVDTTSTTGYQSSFNGTSSASPIVTAAAISLQGIAKAEYGVTYPPYQLRDLLRNTTYNTPSSNPATDQIGYLPNLKNIIDNLPAPIIDTTAPSQPANLTSPSKTSTSISLDWDASTDNVGVDHYEILRNTVLIATTASTSFTDTGLTPSTAYTYTVKAVDAANNKSLPSSLYISTDSGNTVTIYYKKGFSTPYIHYRPAGGTWTTAPGAAMPESELAGYAKYTVNIGAATSLEAVFNNGSGTWDNNGGSNYMFGTGTSTFKNGTITSGTPVTNTVTIYYKHGFSTPYIHWRPEGGTWTTAPGQVMPNSEIAGYSKITLAVESASRAEVCFNNGSGTWDSNGGSNYFFNLGTSTFDSGTITTGTP